MSNHRLPSPYEYLDGRIINKVIVIIEWGSPGDVNVMCNIMFTKVVHNLEPKFLEAYCITIVVSIIFRHRYMTHTGL